MPPWVYQAKRSRVHHKTSPSQATAYTAASGTNASAASSEAAAGGQGEHGKHRGQPTCKPPDAESAAAVPDESAGPAKRRRQPRKMIADDAFPETQDVPLGQPTPASPPSRFLKPATAARDLAMSEDDHESAHGAQPPTQQSTTGTSLVHSESDDEKPLVPDGPKPMSDVNRRVKWHNAMPSMPAAISNMWDRLCKLPGPSPESCTSEHHADLPGKCVCV